MKNENFPSRRESNQMEPITCEELPIGEGSRLGYCVAIYNVEKSDEYYQELPGLITRRPNLGGRSLYVGHHDRGKIVPILRRLLDQDIVKNLLLLFPDRTYLFVDKKVQWEGLLSRTFSSGQPILLGTYQTQVGIDRPQKSNEKIICRSHKQEKLSSPYKDRKDEEDEFNKIRKKTLRQDLHDWGVKSFVDGRCCRCNLSLVESCALECTHTLFCRICFDDYEKSPFNGICPVCLKEDITYELWDTGNLED